MGNYWLSISCTQYGAFGILKIEADGALIYDDSLRDGQKREELYIGLVILSFLF